MYLRRDGAAPGDGLDCLDALRSVEMPGLDKVLAVIIAIGPVTVAASMFPAATRRALSDPGDGRAVVRSLHRICQVYATVGVVVPVFGLTTASSLGVLGDTWLMVSIVLTAIAAAVLVLLVLPRQIAIVAELDTAAATTPHEG